MNSATHESISPWWNFATKWRDCARRSPRKKKERETALREQHGNLIHIRMITLNYWIFMPQCKTIFEFLFDLEIILINQNTEMGGFQYQCNIFIGISRLHIHIFICVFINSPCSMVCRLSVITYFISNMELSVAFAMGLQNPFQTVKLTKCLIYNCYVRYQYSSLSKLTRRGSRIKIFH